MSTPGVLLHYLWTVMNIIIILKFRLDELGKERLLGGRD